jgi:hypothetical protein
VGLALRERESPDLPLVSSTTSPALLLCRFNVDCEAMAWPSLGDSRSAADGGLDGEMLWGDGILIAGDCKGEDGRGAACIDFALLRKPRCGVLGND